MNFVTRFSCQSTCGSTRRTFIFWCSPYFSRGQKPENSFSLAGEGGDATQASAKIDRIMHITVRLACEQFWLQAGYRVCSRRPCWRSQTINHICIKIKFISQRKIILLFRYSNVAAVNILYTQYRAKRIIDEPDERSASELDFCLRPIPHMPHGHKCLWW